jgi:hypothetical protein
MSRLPQRQTSRPVEEYTAESVIGKLPVNQDQRRACSQGPQVDWEAKTETA